MFEVPYCQQCKFHHHEWNPHGKDSPDFMVDFLPKARITTPILEIDNNDGHGSNTGNGKELGKNRKGLGMPVCAESTRMEFR